MGSTLADLVERQAWAEVLALLTALDELEARCRESQLALLADLALVLRRAARPLPHDFVWSHPSGARLDRLALALLETALDAHREALRADPGRLFPVLYNALYWRDAPEGDAHYATPPPRDDRQIWRWMESWRREFEARPHARWLRRIRPPRPNATALLGWRTAGGSPTLSPDGALLLVTHADSVELIDAHTGRSLGPLPRPQGYLGRGHSAHGGFSPDSDRVLTFRDDVATLWSVAPLAPLRSFGPPTSRASTLSCAAFSRDGRVVFTGTHDAVDAWDAEDGSPLATLETPTGLSGLYPCGDDRVLVTDRAFRLWSPRDGGVFAPPRDAKTVLWSVAMSSAGDRLIVRSNVALEGFALGTRRSRGGARRPRGKQLFRQVFSSQMELDLHPAGDLFALLGNAQICELRDMQTGDLRASLPTSHVQRMTFDPSGRFLLLGQVPRSALWDLHANAAVAWAWQGANDGEGVASFSRDGSRLAVGDADTTLVLDLATLATAPAVRDDTPPPIGHPAWLSPGGSSLAAQTRGGLAFWDVASGRLLRVVPTQHYAVRHGRHVLCYRDGELVALDPETGVDRFVLRVPGDPLQYPNHGGEGDTLLARTHSGLVVGFSLEDGRERYRLPSSGVFALLAPDLFVIRNSDGTLGIYAVSTGRELLALPERAGRKFLLSPDRRWLAVHDFPGGESSVEVWELVPGGRRHLLHGAYDHCSTAFSADGARVTLYSSGPTPQSGNSDADESYDEAALEPGDRFLPAADVPAPAEAARRLKDVAPELCWDRGGRSLTYGGLAYPLSSGLIVVDVTADQVELYRLSPAR